MVSSEGRSFAELRFHEIITGQADRPLLYPARDGQDLLICCKKAAEENRQDQDPCQSMGDA